MKISVSVVQYFVGLQARDKTPVTLQNRNPVLDSLMKLSKTLD